MADWIIGTIIAVIAALALLFRIYMYYNERQIGVSAVFGPCYHPEKRHWTAVTLALTPRSGEIGIKEAHLDKKTEGKWQRTDWEYAGDHYNPANRTLEIQLQPDLPKEDLYRAVIGLNRRTIKYKFIPYNLPMWK